MKPKKCYSKKLCQFVKSNKQLKTSYSVITLQVRMDTQIMGHRFQFSLVLFSRSRRLRWAGHVARMEEGRSAFEILTGKPTGKRPLGRPRHR